jgi:hypothetical protein
VVSVGEHAGRGVAIAHAQLASGAVAIGVDRGLGHAKLTGDLLGAEVSIHQPQAFPLTRRQKFDATIGHSLSCPHRVNSKRLIGAVVYFAVNRVGQISPGRPRVT